MFLGVAGEDEAQAHDACRKQAGDGEPENYSQDVFHFAPPAGGAKRFGLNQLSRTVLRGFIRRMA